MQGVFRVILSALSVERLGRATVLAACDAKPCYDAVRPSAQPLDACNLRYLLRRSYQAWTQ